MASTGRSRVAFLNFLPRNVGTGAERFASGTAAAVAEGKERVIDFLEQHRPDHLFVFSRKAWQSLPGTLEDERKESGERVLPDQDFDRHHYRLSDGHVVQAVALRHPQGAVTETMKKAVTAALQMRANPPV